MKMTITVELTESEIREILTDHFKHQYNHDATIALVLPNIVNSTDYHYVERVRIIDKIKELSPKSKIDAIKTLRMWSVDKYKWGNEVNNIGLKNAKDFVESPHLWERFLKDGYIMGFMPS